MYMVAHCITSSARVHQAILMAEGWAGRMVVWNQY